MPYEVTEELRQAFAGDDKLLEVGDLTKAALEYLGEYEHGSVDIEDLLPAPIADRREGLKVIAAVLVDFIQSYAYMKRMADEGLGEGYEGFTDTEV